MAGKTIFEIQEAENWKRRVDELVERLGDVLHQIYLVVSEKVEKSDIIQEDTIMSKMTEVSNTLNDVFQTLINCVKRIVGALVHVIGRMRQAAQNIEENATNAKTKLAN